LVSCSAEFSSSLPDEIVIALSDLVKSMNCYYRNLIEGHNTHPIDIELALKGDYSLNTKKRNLQLEAKAHIDVQRWIDNGNLLGRSVDADGICEIHKRFCEQLPEELLTITEPETGKKETVIPGSFRDKDVKVGVHIPISPGAISRFMKRFEQVYGKLSKSESIIAIAAAHHRLLWIHPFLDGNGRVARLMSHATLLETLKTKGIWSIARGLARNVNKYKEHLARCDSIRHSDLDGRGNLSESELIKFTQFFLETCIDQVKFMQQLVKPNKLINRILIWVESEIRDGNLPSKSDRILETILYRGELKRSEIANILDVSERHARRTVSALIKSGAIKSETTRTPLKIAFPSELASQWMPGLFPEY